MTTVRPLPQFNITSKSTRAPLAQPCRQKQLSVVVPTDVISDVNEQTDKDFDDDGFCGEPFADNGELLSSLSPMLFSIKLFGLYFHREDRLRRRSDDPGWNPATTTPSTASNKLRVYATVALILSWLNVFRLAFLFTNSDHFGAVLLMKIPVFTWFVLSAIMRTAYYYASHTGKLLKVLLTLPMTQDCVRGAHRVAIGITALAWINMIINGTVSIHFYFGTDGKFDYILAPMVTYIEIPDDKVVFARLIGNLLHVLLIPSYVFAALMTQVLVYVFYHQFRKLKKNFSLALGKRRQFSGDLSVFRRRHLLTNKTSRGRLQHLTFMRVAPSTSPDTK